MKAANVYSKDEVLLIVPIAITEKGVGRQYHPVERIILGEDSQIIGESILRAFDNHIIGVPHLTKMIEVLAPILKAAGVRSWKELNKNSKLIGVIEKGGKFIFEPSINQGSRKGYIPIRDKIIEVDSPLTPFEIGQKVLECLSLSIDDHGLT